MTQGEGWHNYHHVFPWDYKTAELGNYRYNITTAFIDFFAKIGWAYDLKTVSKDTIQKRMARSGDLNVKYSEATVDDLMRLQANKHDEPTEPKELVWVSELDKWLLFTPNEFRLVFLPIRSNWFVCSSLFKGWDDADFDEGEKKSATILHKVEN